MWLGGPVLGHLETQGKGAPVRENDNWSPLGISEAGTRPSKEDLAYAITMSKRGTHAPKAATSDFSNPVLVLDVDRQRTR